MTWSVADELAVTKRRLNEDEVRRSAQTALIETLIGRGQSTAEAEHVLQEIEAALVTLRARRLSLEALQRQP
jgi:hypothetical protein